ncbi:PPC domain-containing protein, partial [Myxococcota bacterium]|nr:PPC domain-containing protein [Myxococcota bacterium]
MTKRILLPLLLLLFAFSCDDDSSSGEPPHIIQGAGAHQAYVGMEFSVQIVATDADTTNLTFTFDAPDILNQEGRAHPPQIVMAGPQAAYFLFTPIASDVGMHNVDIIVSDGSSTDRIVLNIDVKSSTGTNPFPVFIEPLGSGTTLDLSKDVCIDVEILVEDNDSSSVDIYMEDPIHDGYSLNQDSPQDFEAIFSWCPTAKQISETDRYTLNIAADDRDGHITRKRYVIILRRDLEENCPGEAPVIIHTAPADRETLDTILLTFTVTDDMGINSPPIVYYTTTQPSSTTNPDPAEFVAVTANQTGGDSLSGTYSVPIPNPVLSLAAGQSATVWYFIEAEDNDDESGPCDHRTQLPDGSLFSFDITHPSGTIVGSPPCTACQSDLQCGGENDLCVFLMSGSAYCLEDCQLDPDSCPSGTACSQDPITGSSGVSRRQCIPITGTCGSSVSCTDDSYEDNDSLSPSLPLMGNISETGLKMCSDPSTGYADEDWYRLSLGTTTLSLFEIMFQHGLGDLDLELYNGSGTMLSNSLSVTNNESIIECLPAGEYYVAVYSWDLNLNQTYGMTFDLVENGCCADDALEGNNDYQNAMPVLGGDYLDDLTICEGDEDWFAIDLNAGDLLLVSLLFDQNTMDQDLDVYLYDVNGTTNLTPCCDPDNGQSGTSDEELLYEAATPGTYYIQVVGYDNSVND